MKELLGKAIYYLKDEDIVSKRFIAKTTHTTRKGEHPLLFVAAAPIYKNTTTTKRNNAIPP